MAAINTFFPAGDTYIMGSLGTIAELIMFAFRKQCWPGLKVAKFFFLQARDCNRFPPLEKGTTCPYNVFLGTSWHLNRLNPRSCGTDMHWHKVCYMDTVVMSCFKPVKADWRSLTCTGTVIPRLTLYGTSSTQRWLMLRRSAINNRRSMRPIPLMVDMRSHLVSLPNPMQATVVFPWIFCPLCYNSGKAWWRTGIARRLLDQLAKRDRQTRLAKQLGVFNGAWQRRQFAEMWKVARRLSGKNLGPKQRVYSKPITERPCIDEGAAHLARPGKDGGWNAERVFELPNCQQDTIFEDRQIFHLAQSDLCGIAFHLHRAKLRKATPPWAAPAEVWRQLFFSAVSSESVAMWYQLPCLFCPRYVI